MGGPHDAARALEFELDLIRARIGEGRERAKTRGIRMGRCFNVGQSAISRLAV